MSVNAIKIKITGPAASGKTTVANIVAGVLSRDFPEQVRLKDEDHAPDLQAQRAQALRDKNTQIIIGVKTDGAVPAIPLADAVPLEMPSELSPIEYVKMMYANMGITPLDGKVFGMLFRCKDDAPVPADEFIAFRPADNALPDTLRFYRAKCRDLGCDQAQMKAIDDLLDRVLTWREQHPERLKLADVEPGELAHDRAMQVK